MSASGCAGVIMAGGRASRLGGRAKGLIEIDHETIIERQLKVLRPIFGEILLVANDREPYDRFGLPTVSDRVAGCGPLGGLDAALAAARAPQVFMCACDMPALNADAVRLFADAPDADVVVGVVGGREEPLHARYSKRCQPAITRALAEQRYKMVGFYDGLNVVRIQEERLRQLDPELRFLQNINTARDLV